MTVVAVLRELWRYRRLVIAGAIVALVFQVMLVYNVSLGIPPKLESRQYNVGVASGAVLIDSQSSQAVDLGGGEGEVKVDVASLSARAQLLANLLVTRPLRDEIAKGAGVAPDRMITELSSTTEPGGPAAGGVRRRGPAGRSGRQHRQAADERDRPDHHDQRPGADRADRRAPGRVHGVDAARLPGRHRLEQRRAGRPQARDAPARRADVRRVAARAAEESRGPRVPAAGRVLVRRRARHVRPCPGLALCRRQRVLEPGRHDRRAGDRRARLRAPVGHRRRRLSGAGRETPRAPCRHAGRRPRTRGRQAVACPNA